MFHVEHPNMVRFLLVLSLFFAFSCTKRDPHPELKDEIYSDLLAEQDIWTKSVEAAKKDLEGLEKDVKSSVPQTGQLKSFEAKYFEAKNAIVKMEQQKQYFDIKVEQRKNEVQDRYEESFRKGGRKWPDPEEVATYKAKLKLYREKIEWDRNKGVVKNVPRGTAKKEAPAGGEHGAAPAGEHGAAPEPAAAEHH